MRTVFKRRPSLGTYRGGPAEGQRSFAIPSLAINSLAISLTCYQPHLLSTHLLSPSLAIPSLVINSLAIKLICYQLSCYHIHLLSSLICYPALTAIDTLAIKPHLLSGQFAINPQLQSTILLSIIICYQIFDLLSIITLTSFFFF